MMIKKIYILTVLLVLIALNTNGQRYEAGVSKELAETAAKLAAAQGLFVR